MPTIVGILTVMSMIDAILKWVEHKNVLQMYSLGACAYVNFHVTFL